MNWFLLKQQENINNSCEFQLSPRSSHHIRNVLKRTGLGESFRAVYPGKSRGEIHISSWINNIAIVNYRESSTYKPKKPSIHIVAPIPRPQTAKKIFHLAGAYGVNSICFYIYDSHSLQYTTSPLFKDALHKSNRSHTSSPFAWEIEWATGVEQTGSWEPLDFIILNKNENIEKYYKESFALSSSLHLVFHPLDSRPFKCILENIIYPDNKCSWNNIFIHLGSERGWTEKDLELKSSLPHSYITKLGDIILRTEFALHAILYELEHIRR